jgi:flagellar basal-body rod modification protein FlgD
MMNTIAANYAIPAVSNTYQPAAAKAAATTTGSSTSSSGTTDVGSTFLSLLVKELQNQDPTAPMDSTAMVGQMISLNQLEQLTSINQAVGGSSTLSGTPQTSASASSLAVTPAGATPLSSSVAAATNQLPFDPNTMMPIGYGANNAAALAASISPSLSNPSLNVASMGVSGYSNNISGGK